MIGVTRPLARISTAAVHSAGRTRAIVVELMPPGEVVGFRLKGTRRTYWLPISWCYREALKAEVVRQRAEWRKGKAKSH